jgi:hypothetical protein
MHDTNKNSNRHKVKSFCWSKILSRRKNAGSEKWGVTLLIFGHLPFSFDPVPPLKR